MEQDNREEKMKEKTSSKINSKNKNGKVRSRSEYERTGYEKKKKKNNTQRSLEGKSNWKQND